MVRERTKRAAGLSSEEVLAEGVDVTFLVWLAARSTSDLMDSRLGPVGLTGDEFAIYSMLNASSAITPSELSRWMAAPPTTVSSYVRRFEARGHVERETNPDDKRSYRIKLTDAGRRTHLAAIELFTPVNEAVSTTLGDDETAIRNALLRLRPALDRTRDHFQSDGAKL